MSLLVAKDIDVSIRLGERDITMLRDLSFSIGAGEILGVIGESGAGKSMVGRMISRLLPPNFRVSRGALSLAGQDLLALSAADHRALLGKRISFIPQEPMASLNPVLTIGDQFSEYLKRLGLTGADARKSAVAEHLAAVKLPRPRELCDRYPHQISGGQCQRVLIAMAFAGNPALIVADEPTTALDVMTQAVIINLLAEMRAKHNTAVILITHDLRLAAHVCDNMMVLYAGEAVEMGSAEKVFRYPRHPYTRSLQQANPPLTGPRRPLVTLPEHMPDLSVIGRLAGCRFAPRCPVADPGCASARQPMRALDENHSIRCSPTCADHAILATEQAPIEPDAARKQAALLVVDKLAKTYRGATRLFGRAAPVDAVRAMSFQIHPGEFVGIVGESGSGKSTVAKLLLGLEDATAGSIVVQGVDVTAQDPSTRQTRIESLQMVFQDPQSALNPRRNVASIVTQAMEAGKNHATWRERLARAGELLDETGLPPELVTRYPAQLSGGQRQRVNIARALCRAPKILVADEIVSGLDVLVQAQILNLLLRLRAQHDFALLFISHDLSVVRHLCSRVLVMYRGEVVEQGVTEEVFRHPRHDYTKQLIAAVPPDDLDAGWAPKLVQMDERANS